MKRAWIDVQPFGNANAFPIADSVRVAYRTPALFCPPATRRSETWLAFRETDDVTGGSGAIIVVLGAPNDDGGRLSAVAASRCALALEQYQRSPRPVLPTGGWGAHFNTTPKPHHQYITACLRSAEVPPEHVLTGVDSANTYEDVALVAEAARAMGARELTVVTSDYHIARVQLLFARLAPDLVTDVLGAHAELPGEELVALEAHERVAIDRLALPRSDSSSPGRVSPERR